MFVYTLNDGLTDLMHPILLIIYNAMIFYHGIIVLSIFSKPAYIAKILSVWKQFILRVHSEGLFKASCVRYT